MASMGEFGQRMLTFSKDLPNRSNTNIKRLAGSILQALVSATPVDTGHARANWQVGLGAPVEDEIGRIETSRVLRSSSGETIHESVTSERSAQATIAAGKSQLEARQPEQIIFITNNVPYIGRLNEGWSAQAPAGFVQLAIQSAMSRFKGVK